MKFYNFIIILFIFSSLVNAQCNSDQIDINSASVSELDNLTGIGPAIAESIIGSRPFTSLDGLLDVPRIGDVTLEKIKSQGLACIESEEYLGEFQEEQETSSAEVVNQAISDSSSELGAISISDTGQTESIINLNSQEIISNSVQKERVVFESKNEKVKRNLIFFFAFFLILIILFLLMEK